MSDILFFEKTGDAVEPTRATNYSAGFDLSSPIECFIQPQETIKIDTGIKIKLPENTYGRVCGRSGTYLSGLFVFDGIIDSDFCGTIKLLVTNTWHTEPNIISKGERIAQLIVQPFILSQLAEVKSINDVSSFVIKKQITYERTDRGLGSSGIFSIKICNE